MYAVTRYGRIFGWNHCVKIIIFFNRNSTPRIIDTDNDYYKQTDTTTT